MRIESTRLTRQRIDDTGVAVSDDWNVVIGVQISAAVLIIHPHPLGTDDLQRLLIEEPVGGGEEALTARQHRRAGHLWNRHRLNSSSNNSSAMSSRARMKFGSSAA